MSRLIYKLLSSLYLLILWGIDKSYRFCGESISPSLSILWGSLSIPWGNDMVLWSIDSNTLSLYYNINSALSLSKF